ncbi:MAG: alpha/beta hydrolase [Phycisphaerae bacterium]|nr:alpha/beta hydrolase [Phycisphaerae bacterium]
MAGTMGYILFITAPGILGVALLWLKGGREAFCSKRPTRQVAREHHGRFRASKVVVLYLLFMSLLIYGALRFVGYIASAIVPAGEVFVVLWFLISWRLAWELWARTVGRLGQKWIRWARYRRHRGLQAPRAIRLIPVGRALLTATVFVPAFLSCVLTHRCKILDGQDPRSIYQMDFEQVRIPTSDGIILDAWFIPEAGASRTILIGHGAGANKGNFVWFLGPLAGKGYSVMFFDFRAHGASTGRTTTYGIRERRDVLAAVEWLKRERPRQSEIIVGLGSSQGAMALALAAAVDQRINAVILDSPFTSPCQLAQDHARRVPVVGPVFVDLVLAGMSAQTGTDFFTCSAVQAVARMGSRPLMVIHGNEDFAMPADHAQRLYDAATGPREIWFGPGPHSNIITTDPREYEQRVFRFLDEHLGPAKSVASKPQ